MLRENARHGHNKLKITSHLSYTVPVIRASGGFGVFWFVCLGFILVGFGLLVGFLLLLGVFGVVFFFFFFWGGGGFLLL